MRIKAKYNEEVVFLIGFCSDSGSFGYTQERAVICRGSGRIESVKFDEIEIIDEEYIP